MKISEEIEKALKDMLIYGTGAILVTEDGLKHIPPGDLSEKYSEVENDNQ